MGNEWGGAPEGSGGNKLTRALAFAFVAIMFVVFVYALARAGERAKRERGPAPIESVK